MWLNMVTKSDSHLSEKLISIDDHVKVSEYATFENGFFFVVVQLIFNKHYFVLEGSEKQKKENSTF